MREALVTWLLLWHLKLPATCRARNDAANAGATRFDVLATPRALELDELPFLGPVVLATRTNVAREQNLISAVWAFFEHTM